MPWTETRPMQRLDFIRASFAGTGFFFACGTAALPGVGINASPGLPIPQAAPLASSPAKRSAAGNHASRTTSTPAKRSAAGKKRS
ncbi:hypothetical protein ABLV17_07835 [Klebsiella sp. CN_Kp091]|uniref:hypothetical protein n=2 Tax=unclassified Klebsiella TaxID=2608929 RepID=UPI0032B3BFD8